MNNLNRSIDQNAKAFFAAIAITKTANDDEVIVPALAEANKLAAQIFEMPNQSEGDVMKKLEVAAIHFEDVDIDTAIKVMNVIRSSSDSKID